MHTHFLIIVCVTSDISLQTCKHSILQALTFKPANLQAFDHQSKFFVESWTFRELTLANMPSSFSYLEKLVSLLSLYNSKEFVSYFVQACWHVGMWECWHVDMWQCGHVGAFGHVGSQHAFSVRSSCSFCTIRELNRSVICCRKHTTVMDDFNEQL